MSPLARPRLRGADHSMARVRRVGMAASLCARGLLALAMLAYYSLAVDDSPAWKHTAKARNPLREIFAGPHPDSDTARRLD